MKIDQKFTPKYWVVHDPKTDDIIPETMSKSAKGAEAKYAMCLFGESPLKEVFDNHPSNEGYEISLVEIKFVNH